MKFEGERRRMVADQLVSRGIRDPKVLSVFGRVPRHLFVPEDQRDQSYTDHPLPIGEGQTISQPYIVALMTERLSLEPDSKVLEVGTGSGYQTAILAELAARVCSIERILELAGRAERLLSSLGYKNILIRVGDGSLGWIGEAPFHRILVTAATPSLPKPLMDQLAEGGRLVIPVGPSLNQSLTVVERVRGDFRIEEVCSCVFVPLIGAYGWKEGEDPPHEVSGESRMD